MQWIVLLIGMLFPSLTEYGLGTVFWRDGDPQNPNPVNACWNRSPGVTKYLVDEQLVVAHKTAPCGSSMFVLNPRNWRWAFARVVDWGPMHATLDMSRGMAKAIGHNGKEPVFILFAAP